MPPTILIDTRIRPRISRNNAWCVLILIPLRVLKAPGGIILQEFPQHWERLSSDGHVVRCHTQLEAQEAAALCAQGIAEGQFLKVTITPYDPIKTDLPYHDWVRGVRGRQLARRGLTESDLPENIDPGLRAMSDADWLAKGPR